MKKINFFIALISLLTLLSFVSDKPAYKLYHKKGKEAKYQKMLEKALSADVVFFGELHNNPIAHWLQFELTKDVIEKHQKKVILGAEMFEADNQLVIDSFLMDSIKPERFKKTCRLWPNYDTDYKPLLELAKAHQLPFLATNIPRKYASLVYKHGLDTLQTLSVEEQLFIAPLPIHYDPEQDAYKSMLTMKDMPDHVNENLPKAQAIKDATMAYFINKNLKEDHIFIHYQGAYHSDKYQGILYYLKMLNPELKILTISTTTANGSLKLNEEDKAIADFIIVVNENMTSTY